MTATWRATQKANRRAALIRSAAHLFAERGFAAVSTGELGEAVGMSGPALYKHFSSKDALLAEILVDVSERLLAGGREILDSEREPGETLERLIRFHLDFATSDPDVIRLQDRELPALAPEDNRRVRRLQREYVQSWDGPLAGLRPDLDDGERQIRLMATFGLLNSTPHSAGGPARTPAAHRPDGAPGAPDADGAGGSDAPDGTDRSDGSEGSDVIDVLASMAWRALTG
ncbi:MULTISPECIES: TetR/AcrR family transcriptional regulator [Micrococcaceae]|uniref:TetR/AcrR family transcriptional regulator n=1 Tax=Micrococcaceae TaxID=1268 RepID=UPI00160DC443|nr:MULTISPECIES: TetR/AcrR family transcriptional regulator [Micrococcaceae]MBB5750673.1 AcrR family transcriptional regulator [Micrococcus sp. TA1]HRO28996.1 TetR/AcrR family transcriptional regulator [Citricoccus sp.]